MKRGRKSEKMGGGMRHMAKKKKGGRHARRKKGKYKSVMEGRITVKGRRKTE